MITIKKNPYDCIYLGSSPCRQSPVMLSLFLTPFFQDQAFGFPNSMVGCCCCFFVLQASLVTFHFCLGFTIQQCFISASSDSSVISSYLLIQHACAADSHVNLLAPQQAVQDQASRPRYHQRQRLSFVLQPRSNHSIHFLHCRLTLCNREPHDSSKTSGSIPKVSIAF